ncbi:hypothetical protein Scep_001995 [Stephania cephalantha]|uniref:Uncharacterized protein n=1 Tax=Stephania cephalantha TaxID=152367 RepID=A0AAP0LCZ1_9MAGN
MDGRLLTIIGTNRESCTRNVVVVIGIYNLDEQDPSSIFCNPLHLYLFLLSLVNAVVTSTRISAGAFIVNISNDIVNAGVASTRICVGTAMDNILDGIGSVRMTGETKCDRIILRSSINSYL